VFFSAFLIVMRSSAHFFSETKCNLQPGAPPAKALSADSQGSGEQVYVNCSSAPLRETPPFTG
jgi:hypothetical protein